MKYTLEGFSQEIALKLTKEIKKNEQTKILRLDIIDLILLRWFVDFFPNMKKHNINGIEYAWVNYKTIVEELPILSIKKHTVYERFKKMCNLGILVHHFDKNGGCYSYYGFGKNYHSLISSTNGNHQNSDPICQNGEGYPSKQQGVSVKTPKGIRQNFEGYPLKLRRVSVETSNKDSSTINPSTKDSSTISFSLGKTNSPSPDSEKIIPEETINYINEHAGDKNIAEKLLAIFNNRLMRGKSVSIKIAEIFLNNLEDYSEGNYGAKIAILDNSILYDAINIFKPKQKEYPYNRGNEPEEDSTPSYNLFAEYDIINEINWGSSRMAKNNDEVKDGEEYAL